MASPLARLADSDDIALTRNKTSSAPPTATATTTSTANSGPTAPSMPEKTLSSGSVNAKNANPRMKALVDGHKRPSASLSMDHRTGSGMSSSSTPGSGSASGAAVMNNMALLVRAAPSVVKTRSGSVLSRGFILKTDHYPSGVLSHTHSLY